MIYTKNTAMALFLMLSVVACSTTSQKNNELKLTQTSATDLGADEEYNFEQYLVDRAISGAEVGEFIGPAISRFIAASSAAERNLALTFANSIAGELGLGVQFKTLAEIKLKLTNVDDELKFTNRLLQTSIFDRPAFAADKAKVSDRIEKRLKAEKAIAETVEKTGTSYERTLQKFKKVVQWFKNKTVGSEEKTLAQKIVNDTVKVADEVGVEMAPVNNESCNALETYNADGLGNLGDKTHREAVVAVKSTKQLNVVNAEDATKKGLLKKLQEAFSCAAAKENIKWAIERMKFAGETVAESLHVVCDICKNCSPAVSANAQFLLAQYPDANVPVNAACKR